MVTTQKYNIIIAGYIIGGPLGGLVWHHLQYVLGLHKIGHQVFFVEDSDNYPSCYNPQTKNYGNHTYWPDFLSNVQLRSAVIALRHHRIATSTVAIFELHS